METDKKVDKIFEDNWIDNLKPSLREVFMKRKKAALANFLHGKGNVFVKEYALEIFTFKKTQIIEINTLRVFWLKVIELWR